MLSLLPVLTMVICTRVIIIWKLLGGINPALAIQVVQIRVCLLNAAQRHSQQAGVARQHVCMCMKVEFIKEEEERRCLTLEHAFAVEVTNASASTA